MTDLFHRAEFIEEVVRIIKKKLIVVTKLKKLAKLENVKVFMLLHKKERDRVLPPM